MDKTRFSLVAIRAEAPAEQRALARLARMRGMPCNLFICSSRWAFKLRFFSVSFGQGHFLGAPRVQGSGSCHPFYSADLASLQPTRGGK